MKKLKENKKSIFKKTETRFHVLWFQKLAIVQHFIAVFLWKGKEREQSEQVPEALVCVQT